MRGNHRCCLQVPQCRKTAGEVPPRTGHTGPLISPAAAPQPCRFLPNFQRIFRLLTHSIIHHHQNLRQCKPHTHPIASPSILVSDQRSHLFLPPRHPLTFEKLASNLISSLATSPTLATTRTTTRTTSSQCLPRNRLPRVSQRGRSHATASRSGSLGMRTDDNQAT